MSQSSSSSAPKYPINVLLLAYQRSGSSVMGEILSAHPNASYFFEPLIEITCKRQISDRDGILSALKRIYQCDSNTLEMIGRSRKAVIKLIRKLTHKPHDVNKPSKACLESQIRVIKTIRLRLNWAKDLLDDENLNLKIIHLVRDPRAILHSVAKSETWSDQARTSEYQCSNIRNDLETGIDLPKDRYMRVRYEDFVDSPLAISVKLYEFLNIPLHKSLASYIAIHTEMDKFSKFYLAKQDYFSTYRKSSYNYNSWMTNMNTIKRQEIEKHCSDVIKLLGYNLTSRKTFD